MVPLRPPPPPCLPSSLPHLLPPSVQNAPAHDHSATLAEPCQFLAHVCGARSWYLFPFLPVLPPSATHPHLRTLMMPPPQSPALPPSHPRPAPPPTTRRPLATPPSPPSQCKSHLHTIMVPPWPNPISSLYTCVALNHGAVPSSLPLSFPLPPPPRFCPSLPRCKTHLHTIIGSPWLNPASSLHTCVALNHGAVPSSLPLSSPPPPKFCPSLPRCKTHLHTISVPPWLNPVSSLHTCVALNHGAVPSSLPLSSPPPPKFCPSLPRCKTHLHTISVPPWLNPVSSLHTCVAQPTLLLPFHII